MKNEEKILDKLDNLARHIVRHDDQFDVIVRHIVHLNEKIDGLIGLPARLDTFENRVMTTLDAHSVMLANLDTERIASVSRFGRIEGDIVAIKTHLGMRAGASEGVAA